jgi:hypothetical protein
LAYIFEVGVAVGAGKDRFGLTSTPRKPLPFGVDRLPTLTYSNERELDKAIRVHCRPYRRRVFNLELLQQAGEHPARVADRISARQLVLLVHGIRTQGEWQEMVRGVLQYGTRATVIPIKYGYLDAARFWLPFGTRRRPLATIRWKIRKAVSLHSGCDVAVIAHSFGTYAIAQLLTEEASFRPKRVLFCGSIVRQHFRWDMIDNCPEILNDCGGRDVWPLLASALSFGYGPSGTFGSGTPGVRDRYHNFKHSDYFQRDFVERFWKPWLVEGRIVALSTKEKGERRPTGCHC